MTYETLRPGRKRIHHHISEKARIKQQARSKLSYAVIMGRVIKKPCKKCGDKKSNAHHSDYSKPLKVVWLCHLHHRLEHARLKKTIK